MATYYEDNPELIDRYLKIERERVRRDRPSYHEQMRRLQDQRYGITPIPMDFKEPAGPKPTTPSWKEDQFLLADTGTGNPTLDYFEEQAKIHDITASSGLEDIIPLLTGALSKFPTDPNLAKSGMELAYDLLPGWGGKKSKLAVTAASALLGVPKTDVLASGVISELKDPVVQAGDYKKNQPGLIGALLSQGENLGAKGNTTGVYGGVPQLLELIDNIQGTGVQDLQGFLQGLGGILGLGEGDIENVKQAARDIDKDKFAGLYT